MKDTPRNNRLSGRSSLVPAWSCSCCRYCAWPTLPAPPSTSMTGSIVQLVVGAFVTALGLWQLRAPKQERPEADQQ